MNKHALVRDITDRLRGEITVLVAAAMATREGATSEESRPENDKDTRAIEASYLAGAQADRVAELRGVVAALEAMPIGRFADGDPASASALITVEVDGVRAYFLLAPQGGGIRCERDGRTIQVITPRSPVGAALLGTRSGDVVHVGAKQAIREYAIIAIE